MGFILAGAASAVGLGNIWRFPTEAAHNGGGAFVVVYIIVVLLFGALLLCTEIALGRKTRKSPIDAFKSICPRSKWVGVLAVMVPALILPYYCVIGGWVIGYLGEYVSGDAASVVSSGHFTDLAGSWLAVGLFIVFLVASLVVIWMGVEKGIERLSKIFMPALLVMIVGLVIYTLLQPGMGDGLSFYLSFHLEDVSGKTLTSALGQAFFSLSLAMGIMITYGSYMKKEDNIETCALSIGIIDTCVALLCGLLIVPLAYASSGGDIPGGVGLVFTTLPQIFDGMAGGMAVAIVFFVLLFIAAWTSAISVAEAVVSTISDKTGWSRHRCIAVILVPMVVVGAIISLGFGPLDFITIGGKDLLTAFDSLTNKIMMPIVAFATCVVIGHIVGTKVVTDEIESSGKFRLKMVYPLMIKWVAPICIAAIVVVGF